MPMMPIVRSAESLTGTLVAESQRGCPSSVGLNSTRLMIG
jgi:hypothetical protein